ncbi:unnamed protein product [Clonostachys solani]|uniref:FAD-binding domain-containing protein n=1 Tax=Clonostachys solani TaxID=160281 RepID=A0A9P0ET22_9HYPO|nr:unnamed protein product [Clonostachys solani]
MQEYDTDVLVVGAGVAGLSTAILLAEQGIRVSVVAKHNGTAPSPRAHVTNQRTMEVFRDMGIEAEAKAAGFSLVGAGSLVMATSLTGQEIMRYSCYGGGDHQFTDFAKSSPCSMHNISQYMLEPVLLARAREKGANIRFYHELVDVEQSSTEVTARVRERTSQGEYVVRAKYLVGADGARSTVATKSGFGFEGEPGLMSMTSSWVEMDLTQYVAHRPACIYWMLQPGDEFWVGSGTCVVMKPWTEWVLNRQYNAEDGEPDTSDEAIIAHARNALGLPDSLPIRVKHKAKWQVNHVVATEYRHGRIFLAGDAAHRHPPSSGLGSNTCVQDAYNLAWKLALVLQGKAGDSLLDTYSQERQPVGKQVVDHAIETLHQMAALPKALGFQRGQSRELGFAQLENLFSDAEGAEERRLYLEEQVQLGNRRSNALGVQLGQRYQDSGAIVYDGTPFPAYQRDPVLYYEPTTHPGAYVPHAWIEYNQQRISVLDIFEHGHFGLVVGIGGKPWEVAAEEVSRDLGIKLPVHYVGLRCPYDDVLCEWRQRREISDRGALLVRPDRHIALRSHDRPENPTEVLRSALKRVLGMKLTLPGRQKLSSMARFNWEDSLSVKNALTPEELDIQETARAYCQERLLPRVLDAYRDEDYDSKILKEMGSLGLLGATIPTHGCAGVSSVASGLIAKEVERVDSGYRSGMSVQSSLVMGPISEHGTVEQKDRFLPQLRDGTMVGCFGLTEPNHGSDPGSMETIAREHPTKKGYFSLSGAKTWITNSPIADLLIVWAKLETTGKIRGFLIERGECPPGTLETPSLKHKNGLRASITGMILLDNCPVPAENMLQVEGLKGPFSCLNSARYGIAFGTMGALEDCIARARTYALDRNQFKKPLASYQLIQKKLADALTDAAYGTLAAIHVGRLKDDGEMAPEMISMIKRQNCDRALTGARANAASDEYHIGRHVANLFVVQTYEGQSDIHCRGITGLQAFH